MEAGTFKADETVGCEAFFTADAEQASLRRFLVGLDKGGPKAMEQDEIAAELNDAFAVQLLRQGEFPTTAEGVFNALDAKIGDAHPLANATQRSFVVAEGSQIAKDPSLGFSRNLRFVVTRGRATEGPDLLVSAFHPRSGSVELMSWDDAQGGFNFYRTISGAPGSWVWAGNSRHAWGPGTRSSGPFESHPTGNLLFKELKLPWVHWHSPKATMDRLDLPAGDDLANHRWFADKDGAYVFEESVARLAIERWNRRRVASVVEAATIEEPQQVLVRLLGAPQLKRLTVNLASSDATQPSLAIRTAVGLPESFFVDVDGLSGVLGLNRPSGFSVAASTYRDALAEFDVKVVNEDADHPPAEGDERFERPGDTHFLFVIPERAFEDIDLVRRLVKPDAGTEEPDLGLITERLAGCLLMVDFPNPVFSDRRASLLDHVTSDPLPSDDWGSFAESLGDTIAAAGKGINPSEAEAEFAALWDLGDGWKDAANEQLSAYYEAVTARLASPGGSKDIFKLAEARRNQMREMPINEVALLLAQTAIPAASIAGLAMNRDGSVESRSEAG